jgi:uncharacterized protein
MFKINIRLLDNAGIDLAGKILTADLELTVPETGLTAPVFSNEAEYSLHASQVIGGVLVTGSVSVDITAQCGRCLERYTAPLTIGDVCHFYEETRGDELDISGELREDILIALPSKYLCSETCAGLCTHCGANLNTDKCSCSDNAPSSSKDNTSEEDDNNPWGALDRLDLK